MDVAVFRVPKGEDRPLAIGDGPTANNDWEPPIDGESLDGKEDGAPTEKGDGALTDHEDGEPPPDGVGRADFGVRTLADPDGAMARKDDD